MKMRSYKFQALVRVAPAAGVSSGAFSSGLSEELPPGQMRRMVIKGEHHLTHGSHFFSALVTNNGDGSDWLDDAHSILTVMLAGEEPAEYFGVGNHFALWSGHDLADGIVTRRLFV